MNADARDRYFHDQVMTAPPQKLHLMLLEAALRHGRRAEQLWRDGQDEQAGEAVLRSQEVMGELVRELKADVAPELVGQVASSYLFILRSLVDAHLHRDAEKLQDALRVLEVECETWRELCGQLEAGDEGSGHVPPPKTAMHRTEGNENSPSTSGLSLEA